MVVTTVRKEDVHSMADSVRPYLVDVHERASAPDPDFLLNLCANGHRTLHIIEGEGFFIANWADGDMHVVVGCAFHGNLRTSLPRVISVAADFAKQCGCSKMTFTSPRQGWTRAIERTRAEVSSINYEVVL